MSHVRTFRQTDNQFPTTFLVLVEILESREFGLAVIALASRLGLVS